jgi:hypothetical protein
VGAVESIGHAQQRGQAADEPAAGRRQGLNVGIRQARRLLTVTARDQRHDLDLDRRETEELARPHEVERVPLVPIVLDRVPDVVQQGGVFEQLAGRDGQPEVGRQLVEELQGEPRHLAAVTVGACVAGRERLDALA